MAERLCLSSPGSEKRKRQRGTFLETSEGAESPVPQDDSNLHSMEALCRSPVISETKEYLKTSPDKIVLSPEVKDSERMMIPEKTLEEQMKELPEFPLNTMFQNHVHGEFCGHAIVIHENHLDYVCDGVLHFVTPSGAVYPHKLAISDVNPATCKFQNQANLPFDKNLKNESELEFDRLQVNKVLTVGG